MYHKKDMFYIAFPWLYNAKTQDYIEICDSNPAAFDFFAHLIGKIAQVSNGIDSNINDIVFNEVKDALKEIQSSLGCLYTDIIDKYIANYVECIYIINKDDLHKGLP